MAVATSEGANLTRYVPRLSAEWALNTSEAWQEVDATLCYIDISGFTALSEKLARRGRIGAEELTEVLNYVFGSMMAVAYDRGGSLVKFGGDALLLLFTGSNHETQAASAAVEMQAVLREARSYETSAGRLSLKMSIGLHSGTVHLFRVGGSHKELILTGPAASMTTEMEETAVAGEILVSPAIKEAIEGEGADTAKGQGWLLSWRKARIECCGWIPRVPLHPEAYAEGLPVALRTFLQHGAAEPEHHIATVGFIKFQGVDALMELGGPPAVADALDELVRNVQAAVDEEEVTFLASDIDQDGGKIIIVGGVPGVQVDDEGRVLRVARRIVDNAGTLSVRIGVNQGHVFVGEVGTEIRATYTIMGDTVNLAARLMASASPGEIYASPSALDHSLTLFDTTPLEPFYVKGKEHPVQAYAVGEVTGSRPVQRGGALPFVGRIEELARLHGAIEELFAGRGNAITITGERGVGKSRLVDEVLPALERAIHIDIRAEPYGIGTPYRPLRDPVRTLLAIKRGEDEEMANTLRTVVTNLLPERAQLTPLLADVSMIDMPSTPEVDQIDPKFRQDRTADLLIEVIAAVCRHGPVVFEVDDGHYMDELSTQLMTRIAAATADHPWLVLTTRREAEAGFDPGMEEILLGPLSDDEARQLVLDATAAAPLRPHEIDGIVRRGGGLPLFLEEIINVVRTAGDIESLPDSLDAVVSSQIDALPPLARRLLRFSSVLGRSFRISVLNQLLEAEGIRLDAATSRELTGFLDSDGTDRLQFRHAMIRDVAYRGLSFRRRRELHIRAGEVAEKAAGDHPESAADVLALHFSLGQDHERAWRYSRMAGDQARDSYANVDAATHYERALDAVRRLSAVSDRDKADVWMSLGDVNQLAGRFDEALDAYRKASRLLDSDVRKEVALVLRRAEVQSKSGNYKTALRETALGRKIAAESDRALATEALARLAVERASIRRWQEKPKEVLQEARTAEEKARAAGELESLGRALELLDWAHWMLGDPDQAVHSGEALRVMEELGDLGGIARIYNSLGGFAYWEGRWNDAISAYQEAAAANNRTGNDVQEALSDANIAEVLINQNRLDEAEPLIRKAVRVIRASGHRTVSWGQIELARLLIRKGEHEEAESLLDEVEQRSEALGESMTVFSVKLQRADSLLQQGRADEALQMLSELEGKTATKSIFGSALARIRGSALAAVGRTDDALTVVESGLDQARSQGLLYDQALLLTLKNQVVVMAGDSPDPEDIDEADRLADRLSIRREPVLASS